MRNTNTRKMVNQQELTDSSFMKMKYKAKYAPKVGNPAETTMNPYFINYYIELVAIKNGKSLNTTDMAVFADDMND